MSRYKKIEEIKDDIETFEKTCSQSLDELIITLIREKDATIERWKTEAENQRVFWREHFYSIFQSAKEAIREDAITEFANRLKERMREVYPADIYDSDIDHIANEMKEENDEKKS